MNRSSIVAFVFVGLFAIGACDSTEPRVPTALHVQATSVAVEMWDTAMISAVVLDQHGAPFTVPPEDHPITWTSSSPTIASVLDGVITGEGPGETTVTVRAGQLTPVIVQVQVATRSVSSQFTFDYNGDRVGSFSVSGTFPVDAIPEDVGATVYDTEHDDQDLIGRRERSDGRYDIIYFWVDGRVTTPGTRPIADGLFVFGYDFDDKMRDAFYRVVSGSVTFSSVSQRRVAGTFSIEMEEWDGGQALSVVAGTFDVPVFPTNAFLRDPDFRLESVDVGSLMHSVGPSRSGKLRNRP